MGLERMVTRYLIPGLALPATVLVLDLCYGLFDPFAHGSARLVGTDLLPWVVVTLVTALPLGMLLDEANNVMHVGALWPFVTGTVDPGGRVIRDASADELRRVTSGERATVRGWNPEPFYPQHWHRRLTRNALAIVGLRIEPLHGYYRDDIEHNRQLAEAAWRFATASDDMAPEARRVQELVDRGHMLGATRVAIAFATVAFSAYVLQGIGEGWTADDARRNASLLAIVVLFAVVLIMSVGRISLSLVRLRAAEAPQASDLDAAADQACWIVVIGSAVVALLVLANLYGLVFGAPADQRWAQRFAALWVPLVMAVLLYRIMNAARRHLEERRIFQQHAHVMRRFAERSVGTPHLVTENDGEDEYPGS